MPSSNDAPQDHLRLNLASTFESLGEIVEAAERFAPAHLADEEAAYRVVLATSEAVTNAIEHGNESDPEKHVTVDFRALDDRLEVVVTDEGKGFDPSTVENPLEQGNLLRSHGRGLHIIKTLADGVSYEEEGRRVRMTFQNNQ